MIYVDESWSLRRELSSSLYDHSAEPTRWALIYVFAMHVNRSENRKIDWFTASRKRVDAQKLSRVFAVYMYVMYMSCNSCVKTLLSFCVYEQRLCCVFAVYAFAMHVFFFFIKCMQSMTMTLSRCYVYAKLHVIWSKLLLYIFSLINHIDSLRIRARLQCM